MVCTLRCLFCKHIFYMNSASQVPSVRSKCLVKGHNNTVSQTWANSEKKGVRTVYISRSKPSDLFLWMFTLYVIPFSMFYSNRFLAFLRIRILWVTEIKTLRVFIADRIFLLNTTFWSLLKISQVWEMFLFATCLKKYDPCWGKPPARKKNIAAKKHQYPR